MKLLSRKWLAFTPFLALLGCASPSWQAPQVAVPAQWQTTQTETAQAAASDLAYWQGFADAELLRLQALAQQRNSDLALAALRLRQAGFAVDKAALAPRPNLNASLNKGASWTLDPTQYRGQSSAANLGLAWEIDLWGKLADEQQAARWREKASEAELAALRQSVAVSVASSYWTIARDRSAVQLAQADLTRAQQIQAMVERRYKAGVVSALDVTQAKSNTLQQENALSQAQLNFSKSQWQLSLLLDQAPAPATVASDALPNQFPQIPAGVPAQVLDRRPDLAAATAKLQASFADQQVQRKTWYPSLSLTGGLGTNSQQLANFLLNPVASLGAGLTLPFIQWNEMKLANQIGDANYEGAVIEYRQKLYVALQEVENALATLAHLRAELPRAQTVAAQSQLAEQQTQLRYQAGEVAFEALLNATARRQAAAHAELLQRYQLALANVTVYKALGGAPVGSAGN